MIYLTAIGQPPGGSSTVHIYTQTIQRTTQNKQYIQQHKNQKECRPCPVFAGFTLTFALQLRKKHGKTSVRMLYLALLLGRYKLVKKAGNETNFLSLPRYGPWIPVFLQAFAVNVVQYFTIGYRNLLPKLSHLQSSQPYSMNSEANTLFPCGVPGHTPKARSSSSSSSSEARRCPQRRKPLAPGPEIRTKLACPLLYISVQILLSRRMGRLAFSF